MDIAKGRTRAWLRRVLLTAAVTAATCAGVSVGIATAVVQKTPSDTLESGQKLTPGAYLQSANGVFTLNLQGDGNLVLRNRGANIWDAHTHGSGVRLAMQVDGNLVVYSAKNKPLWNSRTARHPGASLVLQNDGNAVIRVPSTRPLWSTGTAIPPHRVFTPNWWNGMCDRAGHPGTYRGPSWDGLISCGPGKADWTEHGPLAGNAEWECVELSERWLYQEFGLPKVVAIGPDSRTDGWQVARHYWWYIQANPKRHYPLRLVQPDGQRRALHMGDVVSYGRHAFGHTDVVIATHVNAAGNGTITTLNQNLGTGIGGPVVLVLKVTNWHFAVYGLPATAWLHWTKADS